MSKFTSQIRIPGVAWALLLIILVAVIHENEANLPIDAFYADMIIALIIGVLKSINLGTGQLEQALAVIDAILSREAGKRTRSALSPAPGVPADTFVAAEAEILPLAAQAPPPPNKLVRWLVG